MVNIESVVAYSFCRQEVTSLMCDFTSFFFGMHELIVLGF